jgi:hypothetical protein
MKKKEIERKYLSWRGRCGAYAKHNGKDATLIRMNAIRQGYWSMYSVLMFGEVVPEI